MRVLLVYGNTYTMLAPPPVGLSLLTVPLRRAGHVVLVLDLMARADPAAALEAALTAEAPDLVGFSLRNLDNQAYHNNRSFVDAYVRWVDMANRVAPTIIGGSAVMSAPEAMLERTGATYAMVGEGVRALPHFLEELASGRESGFTAPGLLWREDGAIHANPGLFEGYENGGTMDWGIVDRRRYHGYFGVACVITKTGCPHRCVFCDAAASFGPRYTPRSPEAIVSDLRRDATEYGLHRGATFMIDSVFNEPADWSKQVLEAITRLDHRLLFSAVVEPTGTIDREMARLMRRAGCGMVTCLVGSFDDDVLAAGCRPFDTATVHRSLQHLEDAGVPYMLYFLLGGPHETRDTVLGNHRHLRLRKPIYSFAEYGVRVLPKAGIAPIARDEGVVAADDDLLEPRFYVSESLRNDLPWLAGQAKRLGRPRLGAAPQMVAFAVRSLRVRFQ